MPEGLRFVFRMLAIASPAALLLDDVCREEILECLLANVDEDRRGLCGAKSQLANCAEEKKQ